MKNTCKHCLDLKIIFDGKNYTNCKYCNNNKNQNLNNGNQNKNTSK